MVLGRVLWESLGMRLIRLSACVVMGCIIAHPPILQPTSGLTLNLGM